MLPPKPGDGPGLNDNTDVRLHNVSLNDITHTFVFVGDVQKTAHLRTRMYRPRLFTSV